MITGANKINFLVMSVVNVLNTFKRIGVGFFGFVSSSSSSNTCSFGGCLDENQFVLNLDLEGTYKELYLRTIKVNTAANPMQERMRKSFQ